MSLNPSITKIVSNFSCNYSFKKKKKKEKEKENTASRRLELILYTQFFFPLSLIKVVVLKPLSPVTLVQKKIKKNDNKISIEC
jgi:hypothetical protein